MLAQPGSSPTEAWHALGGHDEKLDGIMVAAYSSGWTDDDVAPLFMDAVLGSLEGRARVRQRYDGCRGLDFVAAGAPALDGSQASGA